MMNAKVTTYRQLKEALKRLSGTELDQPIMVIMEDNPVPVMVVELSVSEEDILVHRTDDEDGGTLEELEQNHGDELVLSEYKISIPKGTVMLA